MVDIAGAPQISDENTNLNKPDFEPSLVLYRLHTWRMQLHDREALLQKLSNFPGHIFGTNLLGFTLASERSQHGTLRIAAG